jgi:methylmalonyl-CoA/ethylmalonyl-CoA epimerase
MNVPEILHGLAADLHHVAIAVPSIAEARTLYEGALGMSAGEVEFVPGQKVNVLVVMAGSQRVELVEPASDDSPITGFLAKRGGGIHHLAWQVHDLADALSKLKARGIQLIHEAPQPGAHGTQVAFLHPKACGGVLMELVQDPSAPL